MDFWNDKILNMSDRRSIPNDRSSILKNPWDIEQEAPLDLSCRGTGAKYCGVLPLKCPRRLPCQTCGKNFDRPSLLKRHLRTHTGEKPHGCSVCGKMFSTSSSLNTHARIHTGERPHECPICGKRFTASSNLYYHRMTHYKEKPHKCNECRRSFPTPGDLRAHGYSHTGDWPLRCPICTRGFCKPAALRHHIQLHSGDRPYHCKMCNKKFSVASNLRAHERMHCSESTDLHSNDCGDIQSDKWLVHDINYEPKGRITLHVPAPILPWTHWLPYSK